MSEDAEPGYVITVGPVPTRKGQWLGVQRKGVWVALAKFRSDQAADDFLALMAMVGRGKAKVE